MKIFQNNQEIEKLDLGIVSAGGSKEFVFEVLNDSKGYLKDLAFKVDHNEVKIVEAPALLDPNETKNLIIEWSPSLDLEEGLKVKLIIEGKKVIKPF
jgi:hypothetical protein